jgi:hypothetical protein
MSHSTLTLPRIFVLTFSVLIAVVADVAGQVNLTGTWKGIYQYQDECLNYRGEETLVLQDNGGQITGDLTDKTISPVAGIIAKGKVTQSSLPTLKYKYDFGLEAEFRGGLVDDNTLDGRIFGNPCSTKGAAITLKRQDTASSTVRPTAISDPPTFLHIGAPPFPIGPSAAFPVPVLHTFDVQDTYLNDANVPSAAASAEYFLSADGVRRDHPLIAARTVPALGPQATDTRVTTLEVGMATPAGRYRVLTCVSLNCLATTKFTTVVNFVSVVRNGVGGVNNVAAEISWDFTPKFGLSPKQAAELGGYDHFNWYQTLVSNTLFGVPNHPFGYYLGVDPQLGGNKNQRRECKGPGADTFKWYFNEYLLNCPAADEHALQLALSRGSNQTLPFWDAPDACVPGIVWVFETYLAGVRADGSGDPLLTIPGVHVHWKYTQTSPCIPIIMPGGGTFTEITVGQNSPGGPSFGTSEFVAFIDPEHVTPGRIQWLKAGGVLPPDAAVAVFPASGRQSEAKTITVSGSGTHFVQGITKMSFGGPEVDVVSLTVVSPTSAVASISIGPNAPTFPRDVFVVTGTEVAAQANGFLVEEGVPAHSWSGLLPPMRDNGVAKAGSTIPLKFRLTGTSAGITDLNAKFAYTQLDSATPGHVNAASLEQSTFRYSADDDQYVLNWRTKGLAPGRYELKIDLGDGLSRSAQITLR